MQFYFCCFLISDKKAKTATRLISAKTAKKHKNKTAENSAIPGVRFEELNDSTLIYKVYYFVATCNIL